MVQLTEGEELLGLLRALWQTLAKLDTSIPEWTNNPLRDLATGLVKRFRALLAAGEIADELSFLDAECYWLSALAHQ